VLVQVLNAALGLDLASFTEAKVFMRSPEGDALLEEWLAAHCDDDEMTNVSTNPLLAEQADTSDTERTTP
jgi:hypothetical protein